MVFLLAVISFKNRTRASEAGYKDISPDSLFSVYYQDRLSLNPFVATSMGLDAYNDTFRNFISEELTREYEKYCDKYELLASTSDPVDLDEQ